MKKRGGGVKLFVAHPEEADGVNKGTMELVPDCVVGGESEQSLAVHGWSGAASNIVKVKDGVQPC